MDTAKLECSETIVQPPKAAAVDISESSSVIQLKRYLRKPRIVWARPLEGQGVFVATNENGMSEHIITNEELASDYDEI